MSWKDRLRLGPGLAAGLLVCLSFMALRAVTSRVSQITWLSDAALFDFFSGWNRHAPRTGALPLVVVKFEKEALERRQLGIDEEILLHTELIEKLRTLGPKVIGFDANVASFREDERTRRLLTALVAEPRVVVASDLPSEESPAVLNPQVKKVTGAFDQLVTGFANFRTPDRVDEGLNRGGVIRTALLRHGDYVSFAAELYLRYRGLKAKDLEVGGAQGRFGEQSVPLVQDRMMIAYGNVDALPALRYHEIVADDGSLTPMARALIPGKIVLIGSFIKGHRDEHLTPLGRIAGSLIHAQILENLLKSRHVRMIPTWTGYLLILAVFLLIEAGRRRLARRKVMYLSWGLATAGLIGMGVLFQYGIWVTGMHAVLAALVLGIVHGMGGDAARAARGNSVLSWLSGSHTVEVGLARGDLTFNLALQVVDPRYQDLDVLGKGGMGIVLSGRDTQNGDRPVAIKLLSPMLLDRGDLVKRFLREIETLRQLHHPGVIQIHETYPDAQVPYYVMELVRGRDLASRWADGEELSRAQVRELFGQLLEALAYVHRQGFVHRDIKPENLMITDDFRLKMLDFGLAYFSEASTLTSDGQILGTLKYMSPEQLHAETITSVSDIFSVGIVLYETLSGKLPYPQVSHVLNFEAPYRPLATMGAKVPPKLEELVAWCLRVKPQERPPDCDKVLERWKQAFET